MLRTYVYNSRCRSVFESLTCNQSEHLLARRMKEMKFESRLLALSAQFEKPIGISAQEPFDPRPAHAGSINSG